MKSEHRSIPRTRAEQLTDARLEVVQAWRSWLRERPQLKRIASIQTFASDYCARSVAVSDTTFRELPTISPRSLRRWIACVEASGAKGVEDQRGKARLGTGQIARHELLRAQLLSMWRERPHAHARHLHEMLAHFADREGHPTPSYDSVRRFLSTWKKENADLALAVSNPDAWKSKSMAAFGSLSEHVCEPNALWEMDASPADWELTDGRHTISVLIDVFSRRIQVVVSKTARSETHKLCLRRALLSWGVPRVIRTDNGQDYVSRELRRVFADLGIIHETCAPFSPHQKPHIERSIKTLQHSILELLPNAIGHSVAQRQELRSRQAFADRLFQKGAVVPIEMTGEQLQRCIDDWVIGIYEQRAHRELGCSPFEKAASFRGTLRKIENERALDALLTAPAGSGEAIIQKKGIRLDGAWFIHPELALHIGACVRLKVHPDLGKVVVYLGDDFLCMAECPERTGIDRQAIAAHAREKQQAQLRLQKDELRQFTRTAMRTDALVSDLLHTKAIRAGKLTVLHPHTVEHSTPALAAELRTLAALTPASSGAPSPRLSQPARGPIDLEKVRTLRLSGTALFAKAKPIALRVLRGETLSESEQELYEAFLADPLCQKLWKRYRPTAPPAAVKKAQG